MSAKEDARMIEAMLDKQDREFTRTSEALEKFVSDVASQLLETARGMSTSPAHDRSGCEKWCGMDCAEAVCVEGYGATIRHMSSGSSRRWCTARCRDLKVGPLEAKVETPDQGRVRALQQFAAASPAGRVEQAQDLFARGLISKSTARELVMSGGHAPVPVEAVAGGAISADSKFFPGQTVNFSSGITCPCCKTTSPGGKAHLDRCEVPQPSAVAAAPRPFVFVPSVSEWDLLPDADR